MSIKAWAPFLALTLILGLVFGAPFPVVASLMILMLLLVSHQWRNHALDKVSYLRRWHYTRSFPGERSPVIIEVENRKLLPVSWLQVIDPWGMAVAPEEEASLVLSPSQDKAFLTHLFSLRWYESTRRTYTILFRKRGIFKVGPARLNSGDLFGIFQQIEDQTQHEYLTVFPDILSLPPLHLETENPFGDRAARRRLSEDPNRVIGVRDYHPEDGFRKVHWPATARTGSLQVKIYQPVSAQVMAVCLNVATMPHFWEGILPEVLEYLVKVAATVVYQGIQTGYAVGLVSNGHLAYSDRPFRVPPGRTQQHLARLLQTLAAVTPLTSTPFEKYLIRAMSDVPFGATLVVITAILTPELSETLVRLLRYRPYLTLISVAQTPPPQIPRVRTLHLPMKNV
jgi:uncharacterized protein (DUF58 family)